MIGRVWLTGAMLALATGAAAQPGGPPGAPRFLFISPSGEPFRTEDGLGDWFAGADADHDGRLSLAEFRADAARYFKVLDADSSGIIDGFEIQNYERVRVPEIRGAGFNDPLPGGGRGRPTSPRAENGAMSEGTRIPRGGGPRGQPIRREGAARFSLLNEPQPVAGSDGDLDGRVNLDEWTRAATKRFNILDKAKTGKLTRDDLPPLPGEPARKPSGR